MKDLFQQTELKMKGGVDHFHDDLKHLRTGRASLAMLDGVTVDYYGTPTPISQRPSTLAPSISGWRSLLKESSSAQSSKASRRCPGA